MFGNYNPYYIQPQVGRMNQQYTPQPPTQPIYNPTGLQGKSVDSLEVVKAMDIPLDGSISYFPLIDGSAIVTKQLQQDGTSKTIIFKPVDNTEPQMKYITAEDLKTELKSELSKLDNSKELNELKDELKSLRRKIRLLVDDKKED